MAGTELEGREYIQVWVLLDYERRVGSANNSLAASF